MRREGRETDTKLDDVTGAKADLDKEVGADEDTEEACDNDCNVLSQSRSEVVELLAEATRKFNQK